MIVVDVKIDLLVHNDIRLVFFRFFGEVNLSKPKKVALLPKTYFAQPSKISKLFSKIYFTQPPTVFRNTGHAIHITTREIRGQSLLVAG